MVAMHHRAWQRVLNTPVGRQANRRRAHSILIQSVGLSPTMIIGMLMKDAEDDELAPAHRNLTPVPEHTCTDECRHREDAKDFSRPAPPIPSCSRCLSWAWRGYNVGERRYEFSCMNDGCRMHWWIKGGKMGLL